MAESITAKRSSALARFARYWLPVLLLLAAILTFSGDAFSDFNTRGTINRLIVWLFPDIRGPTLIQINHFIRKAAHFTEYAVLTSMLFRAFRADSPFRWRLRWAVYSISIVVGWALIDEFRQSFVPSRTATIYDSMIDTAGGVFALLVIYLYTRLRNRRDRV